MKKIFIIVLFTFCFYLGSNDFNVFGFYVTNGSMDEPVNASIDLQNSSVDFSVDYNNYSINLLYFTFYEIQDETKTRYYAADCLKEQYYEQFSIIKMQILTPNCTILKIDDLTLEMVVKINNRDKLVLIKIGIEFNYLQTNLIISQFYSVETLDRINSSDNIIQQYLLIQQTNSENSSNQINNFSNNYSVNTPFNTLNNITNGGNYSIGTFNFDIDPIDGGGGGNDSGYNSNPESLTSTDSYIDVYSLPNNSSLDSNNKITNDDIIYIIPKQYFFSTGEKYYIGKEYGFYLSTIKDSQYVYVTDVFVFDIEVKLPGMIGITEYATVKVEPIFQYKYYSREKGNMSNSAWNSTYSSSLNSVVYPHTNYSSPEYYLTDINFGFNVYNKNELNYGEVGYDAEYDEGDFIINAEYTINGEGKSTKRDDLKLSTSKFIVGSIPIVGTIYSYYDFGKEILENEVNPTVHYPSYLNGVFKLSAGSHSSIVFKTKLGDQLLFYNKLIKTVAINIDGQKKNNNDEFSPVLVGTRVPGHYASASIHLNSKGDFSSIEQVLDISIFATISIDNTRFRLPPNFLPTGNVEEKCTFGAINNHGSFQTSQEVLENFSTVDIDIKKGGQIIYYRLAPKTTAHFSFFTIGSKDTFISIFDNEGKLVAQNDDGGTNYNAKIDIMLLAEKMYFIQIRMYSSFSKGGFKLRSEFMTSGSIILNVAKNVSFSNNFKIYTITPSISKYYEIFTTGNTDTVIYIYNYDFEQIPGGYNDDSYADGILNYNAKCRVYLNSGETYYIKVYLYNYNNGSTILNFEYSYY